MQRFMVALIEAKPARSLISVVAVILIVVGILTSGLTLYTYSQTGSDLLQDYYAGIAIRTNNSIYDPNSNYPNNHPPFTVLMLLPLTFFSPNTAFVIWGIVCLLIYIGLFLILDRSLAIKLITPWKLLIIGVGLIWYPFIAHISLGQISIVVAASVIEAWYLLRTKHEKLAGIMLGFATAFKLYPILLILYLLLRKRYKALTIMVFSTIGFSIIPLLVIQPTDYWLYITQIIRSNTAAQAVFPINISLTGLIGRLMIDGPWITPLIVAPQAGRKVIIIVNFLMVLATVIRLRKLSHSAWNEDIAYTSICITILLVSPISWQHSLILLLLPFSILLYRYQQCPSLSLRFLSLITFLIFSMPDILFARIFMAWNAPFRMSWLLGLFLSLPTFGLLILWHLIGSMPYETESNTPIDAEE